MSRPPGFAPNAIPFVGDWDSGMLFSDIEGAQIPVRDLAQMLRGWTEVRRRDPDRPFEAAVGEWNTVDAGLIEMLSDYRRAVVRITVPDGQRAYDGTTPPGGWTGTGFLVGDNVLLTNQHVINDVIVAETATAEFGYERTRESLYAADGASDEPKYTVTLAPSRLFVASPAIGGYDYAFVWINRTHDVDPIRMERGSFSIALNEPTFVIHHPQGRLKEVSLDDTDLVGNNSEALLYTADTDYGSSGACVFNRNGRLVALHHARREGRELARLFPDAAPSVKVGNEGIKLSAIAIDLEKRVMGAGDDAESARQVMRLMHGSDTLAGIFGALGRNVQGEGAGSVRSAYTGSDQDIDIGFWNLSWLRDLGKVEAQLRRAGVALTDLALDVWCLTEVEPQIAEALIKDVRDQFGEDYAIIADHPGTAIIYRRGGVDCVSLSWPPEVEAMWSASGPGGRRIFEAPPPLIGLKRFATGTAVAHAVPVSLRALRGDEAARREASRRIVEAIDAAHDAGHRGDWIVGGDFRPPLAREHSGLLAHRGYTVAALVDRQRGGAVSYLHADAGNVEQIYATGDMTPLDEPRDFLEIAADRTVDKYLKWLANNRPAVLRLSLAQPGAAPDTGPQPSAGPARWSAGLSWHGLDRAGFLRANRRQLEDLAALASAGAGAAPGTDVLRLTLLDLAVLLFCEAGLSDGRIDPDASHPNGARGLLPLPPNIAFWIGAAAPPWDRPMTPETNLEAYAFYLAALKNKAARTIGGRVFYRDLFRSGLIGISEQRQAKLLAGVVHGCFVASNYGGRAVPVDAILSAYGLDHPLQDILSRTGFVHAGTDILVDRQADIDAALQTAQSP
ncbi:hypothetical protein GE300_14475 [Rhodobacteraceae bacterium 2CG4]|uniref:Serine protease n=1 Tax=Halovulum marinum TaxID=2662447 RepID=A0A6L5Z2L5_9RHOB|nr:trypsin-like peptidase domain-containing protein [Halovulum marinum]MSU90806.1 hypothetical protein [Halovulum marinum]